MNPFSTAAALGSRSRLTEPTAALIRVAPRVFDRVCDAIWRNLVQAGQAPVNAANFRGRPLDAQQSFDTPRRRGPPGSAGNI